MARKSDLEVPEVILKSNSLILIEKNVIDYLFFNLVNDKKRCFTIKERDFVLENANLYSSSMVYGITMPISLYDYQHKVFQVWKMQVTLKDVMNIGIIKKVNIMHCRGRHMAEWQGTCIFVD